MRANLDVCARCGHIRQHHDTRLVIGGQVACPLPCECVGFMAFTPVAVAARGEGE